ncbi:MAG TPA: nucleotide disphospho-sugar-binding domain-containing protein [Solirubrobacterales bacterium]|nr:nucleotide disphospho-sugar-binding domain-containing protein [Solirubrobacterales bacterium]
MIERLRPEVVVNDILTIAPALAADLAGVPRVTLIPHLYPVTGRGLPIFALGLRAPRTPVGKALWHGVTPLLEAGLRHGRNEWNEQRHQLGLAPVERLHGGLSERLTLVATFPQLEYPRAWPDSVHLTGPMPFEVPHPDVELPPGDDPLILVAPSTSQDPHNRLVRSALAGLADLPVRVMATTNRVVPSHPVPVPANAALVDWLSYSQTLPRAALVISHGGHGTIARCLDAGVPVLVSPVAGDMGETAARIGWAGVGRSVPWRLCGPRSLRWAVQEILAEPGYRAQAARVATWSAANPGAERGAELIEQAIG